LVEGQSVNPLASFKNYWKEETKEGGTCGPRAHTKTSKLEDNWMWKQEPSLWHISKSVDMRQCEGNYYGAMSEYATFPNMFRTVQGEEILFL
jgi:hypothetical protein